MIQNGYYSLFISLYYVTMVYSNLYLGEIYSEYLHSICPLCVLITLLSYTYVCGCDYVHIYGEKLLNVFYLV